MGWFGKKKDDENKWIDMVRKLVHNRGTDLLPETWKPVGTLHVGGLIAVGFAEDSELLLVVSHDGRGVFDCRTGEKIARERTSEGAKEDSWHRDVNLLAEGIGPLKGVWVRLAGLWGGGLPNITNDGWHTEYLPFDPCDPYLILLPPMTDLWADNPRFSGKFTLLPSGAGEVRAFGFSYTGQTLIIATSADIAVYGRSSSA